MGAYVYILASKKNGTLYVGVTSNLLKRIYEHKSKVVDGFTTWYAVDRLVFYEGHATMPSAIQREKNIKHWSRKWKTDLIEKFNPDWNDLYDQLGV